MERSEMPVYDDEKTGENHHPLRLRFPRKARPPWVSRDLREGRGVSDGQQLFLY